MTELPAERPPLRITVDKKDIKMTYGLEMDLRRLFPDPNTALQLMLRDGVTQDYVVRRCLTDAKKLILTHDDLIPASEVELDPDETEQLLMWATDHVLYFFVKRAMSMTALEARYGKTMGTISTPSEAGSENSPLMMPSAGPSA